jgi:hypothetical protein
MAVSGCTRECAEAQSKDVGVIATDKGWNLYLCGNGGMKPRHADLFASDLDDETLIRTVDRFLMFYIRTADRLQRTSTWMDNLEGGLDYLREVILNDSLGIAHELEQEMARVVETYQCEWQTTLNDPNRLALFRTAVNDTARMKASAGRKSAASTISPSRRASARGLGVSRSRCSALAKPFTPSTIGSRAAARTCFPRHSWRCGGEPVVISRSTSSAFACATAVRWRTANPRCAPGR